VPPYLPRAGGVLGACVADRLHPLQGVVVRAVVDYRADEVVDDGLAYLPRLVGLGAVPWCLVVRYGFDPFAGIS
jgi:hypothetical protein